MKEERDCWEIGDLMFCASRYDEKGWLVYGMIGEAGMSIEVIEEEYIEGDLGAIRYITKNWARDYATRLVQAAQEFQP
jgi:hypothetical protein